MILIAEDRSKTMERSFTKLDRALLVVVLFTATCAPFASLFGMDSGSPFATNGFLAVLLAALVMALFHFNELRLDRGLKILLGFAIIGTVTSLVMSLILNDRLGELYGQSTMTTSLPSICWLFFNFVTVLYFSWSYSRVSGRLLDSVFDAFVVFVFLISALEIVLGETFSGIISKWVVQYDVYISRGRICGVATEPSTMSAVLGMICLPYCYARFKRGAGKRYIVAFAALILVAFFTKSTTVYITVLFVCTGILVRECGSLFNRNAGYLALAISLIGLILILSAVAIFGAGDASSSSPINDAISGVVSRATSTVDLSGAYRNSTIVNDWKVFSEYPLCGVGDGNQGFFYAQNLPDWILLSGSVEVIDALSGVKGVLDGGAFIGSVVSGYGIIGIVMCLGWLTFVFRKAKTNKIGMGHYYDMFLIALCGSLPILWMNMSFKGAPVAAFAVFCLPYISAFTHSNDGRPKSVVANGDD